MIKGRVVSIDITEEAIELTIVTTMPTLDERLSDPNLDWKERAKIQQTNEYEQRVSKYLNGIKLGNVKISYVELPEQIKKEVQ